MIMKHALRHLVCAAICFCGLIAGSTLRPAWADDVAKPSSPEQIFAASLDELLSIVEPGADSVPKIFSARLKVIRAAGLPQEFIGREIDVAFQSPDRARLSVTVNGATYAAGREGQRLWLHVPHKKFGLIGSSDVPRFSSAPQQLDGTVLSPFELPMPRDQLANLLLPLCIVEGRPAETIDGVPCTALRVTSRLAPDAAITLWVRQSDRLLARAGFTDGKGLDLLVELQNAKLAAAAPADNWKLQPGPDDKIETVALSHLTRCFSVALSGLKQTIPPLGPATGERRVLARDGAGRLETIDGTRVLFLQGTPEEMGMQHGHLLKREIRSVVERIVYGIGVGSSVAKGSWFFGEIEAAQKRLAPFLDDRYVREIDALAAAAGIEQQEARLANVFPELFHCSGFALFGDATAGGRMFHGRILDYMKGVGLEQSAVVMVFQPDQGHAWVNLSYAGFVGSVTAMNDQQIAIGEMGGRGEGKWDGKPMAQLMREVMERSSTIDEAVEIMRRGPRTCEYYYVISDAKSKRAVGISATPTQFETIWAGEAHPRLPHPIKDTVLMSAGERYETLVERVRKGYGKFDADTARDLMTRPVCMASNIQSVLFAPDTLDFWVANADSRNVASHTRYTQYNLRELLKPEVQPAQPQPSN
jgi:hypothetical protein